MRYGGAVSLSAAIAIVLAMSACGGGGGSNGANPSVATTPAVPQTTASPSSASFPTASMILRFSIAPSTSSGGRSVQWVSPSAASFVTTVVSYNGGTTLPASIPRTVTTPLATGSGGNCTVSGSVETCTISTIPAPAGTVIYNFAVMDASGNVVSALNSATQAWATGGSQTFTVTLQGVVSRIALSSPSLNAGTAASVPVTVTAVDADGNPISGTYYNSITVADNDSSGATSLSLNSGASAASATLTSSADALVLAYSGKAFAGATLSSQTAQVSSTGGTITDVLQPIVLSGTTTCTTAAGCATTDADYNAPTLLMTSLTGAQTFGASEAGWTNSPFNQSFTAKLNASGANACNGVATVNTSTGTSFTVTPAGAGICYLTLTDFSGGQSQKVWISVATATIYGQ